MRISLIAFAGFVFSMQGCGKEEAPNGGSGTGGNGGTGGIIGGSGDNNIQVNAPYQPVPRVGGGIRGQPAANEARMHGGQDLPDIMGGYFNPFENMNEATGLLLGLSLNPAAPVELRRILNDLVPLLVASGERIAQLGQAMVLGLMDGNPAPARAFLESYEGQELQPLIRRLVSFGLKDPELVAAWKNPVELEGRAHARQIFEGLKNNKAVVDFANAFFGRELVAEMEDLIKE